MSNTSPLTATEQHHNIVDVVEIPGSKPQLKSSRQRFKPQLSCTFCRHRKLKCDRNIPCENCQKRNQGPSCTYVHATLREKTSQVQKSSSSSIPGSKDVQGQIRHLEDLVLSLMGQTNGTDTPLSKEQLIIADYTPDDNDNVSSLSLLEHTQSSNITSAAESLGRITIGDKNTNYVGSDHWAAILDSIAYLKDQFETTDPPTPYIEPVLPGPHLLVGSVKAATRIEILAAMPSREVVDAFTKIYFNTPDIGATILHFPTFMNEYASFWRDPSKTSTIWIGLLYSILCLSALFQQMNVESGTLKSTDALRDLKDMVEIFREKTVQCLVLSNYTDPKEYTVETLLLYFVLDHFRSSDTQFGAWMVFGLIVRAAMRLGLHREPSNYPHISVFKGEMQRRLWASILHLDLQTSLQVGLPRMLKEGMYDTQQPRNLLDEDFDQNITVLPPPREETESTAIGYSNSKHRVMKVFGIIVDQANSVQPIAYQEVMKLDRALHDVYDEVPEALKVREIDDLEIGVPITKVRKFAIDLIFQKARCILHRKFFVMTSPNLTYPYPYSMKACIDAAMRLLQSQIYIHSQTSLGRQLYSHRWKTSSLMLHDFLLAAMLVCLYLGQRLSEKPTEKSYPKTEIRVKWSIKEMRNAIEGSRRIWEETSGVSREAHQAALALKAMLNKIDQLDLDVVDAGITSYSSNAVTAQQPGNFIPDLPAISWELPTFESVPANLNLNIPLDESTVAESLDWQLWDEQFYANRRFDLNSFPNAQNLDTSIDLSSPGLAESFLSRNVPP